MLEAEGLLESFGRMELGGVLLMVGSWVWKSKSRMKDCSTVMYY